MGGRNDNSPDCPRRQPRPLSNIQEHSDEEGGNPDAVLEKLRVSCRAAEDAAAGCQRAELQATSGGKVRRKAVAPQQHPILRMNLLRGNDQGADPSAGPDVRGGSSSGGDGGGGGGGADVGAEEGEGHLSQLKDTATKLKLKTRRPSYLTWRAKYLDKLDDMREVTVAPCADGRLTPERKEKMDSDIQWIRKELLELRRQDQSLSRQFLGIWHKLRRLRLRASLEMNKELLEDAQDEVEELRELSRFVDFSPDFDVSRGANSFRQNGVTKMNLMSRRFSTC